MTTALIVDSHCHVSDRWYEPVETLLAVMDRTGVHAAVLVQMLGSFDPSYMLSAVAAHPQRFVAVGSVQAETEGAVADLSAMAARLAGVRLRPTSRSPGPDPLAIWKCARDNGLAISCVGKAADFAHPDFCAIADALSDLPIVLEHLGGLARPDVGDRALMSEAILALAACPNIFLKLPGLGQLAERRAGFESLAMPLDLDAVLPLLDRLIRAFGPERIMWGSDFPPVASREGFANALAWPRSILVHHGQQACDAMFGGTARRLFFRAG